jgi:hypothetical protein
LLETIVDSTEDEFWITFGMEVDDKTGGMIEDSVDDAESGRVEFETLMLKYVVLIEVVGVEETAADVELFPSALIVDEAVEIENPSDVRFNEKCGINDGVINCPVAILDDTDISSEVEVVNAETVTRKMDVELT